MLRPGVPVAIILAACSIGWQFTFLVLSASRFQHILNDPGWTSKAYAGHASLELSSLSNVHRGMILQELCKKELARINPNHKFKKPTQQRRCNGSRRSASQAEYDFTWGGRKVKCKSARMMWDTATQCWMIRFFHVKLPWPGFRCRAPFDDLYLILFSPDSLHIIKHDLKTGVATRGKRTGSSGHDICVRGAARQECWQTARSQILDKFLIAGHCDLITRINLSAKEVMSWLAKQMEGITARQDHEYKGVPLNDMTPELRGFRIQQVAFEVDKIINQNGSFSQGSSRVDWVRGKVKVEVKHGQMSFQNSRQHWQCRFSNIKCAGAGVRDSDLFDELWLAIYSPFGIHILKHPGGQVRSILTGVKEQNEGRVIDVFGSKNVLDIGQALDEMLSKMVEWGCQPLAEIVW